MADSCPALALSKYLSNQAAIIHPRPLARIFENRAWRSAGRVQAVGEAEPKMPALVLYRLVSFVGVVAAGWLVCAVQQLRAPVRER